MASADAHLTIVAPFFAGNVKLEPLLAELSQQPGRQRFPALRRLLSRANRQQLDDASVDALLCRLFSVDTTAGIPYAALSWLADTGKPAEKGLLRLDPVHLHPDMEYVLLFDSLHFELGLNQARELVDSLNEFLQEEGWQIETPRGDRWYLVGVDSGETSYTPIHEVQGENILPHMPEGKLKGKWRQILNELQMQLHVHPVNEKREQQGAYTINGVWPWGDAPLMNAGEHGIRVCYGDSVLLKGLSSWARVTYTDKGAEIEDTGKTLVVLPELHDFSVEAFENYLQVLEQDWLEPVAEMLNNGKLASVDIYIGAISCYTMTKKTNRRWWRRTQALEKLF